MKSILVPYRDDQAGRTALTAAITLAQRFGSFLQGVMAAGIPPLLATSGAMLSGEVLAESASRWRAAANEARENYTAMCERAGLPIRTIGAAGAAAATAWMETDDAEADVVGDIAKLFDLVVVGRSSARGTARWQTTCEAALFEAGRPVLVTPASLPETLGSRIVLAWNGSVEAVHSAAFSLPLLTGAELVSVVTVDETPRYGPTGESFVPHLARHGIRAVAQTVIAGGRPAGEAILDAAADLDADLVVKGAFTRHRLREVIFGGVTRHLIDNARLPLLLAH